MLPVGTYITTRNILDPEKPTSLWVGWHRGILDFGRGSDEGVNGLINFIDRDDGGPLEINAISLTSASQSYWDIGQSEGDGLYTLLN